MDAGFIFALTYSLHTPEIAAVRLYPTLSGRPDTYYISFTKKYYLCINQQYLAYDKTLKY